MDLRELIAAGCIRKGEVKHALDAHDPPGELRRLMEEGKLRYRAKTQLARHDSGAFCGFVLRDEETDERIRLAPYHHEWHELIEAEKRLVIWSHIEAGKTSGISVGYSLWRLGRNPNTRVVIVSSTGGAQGTAAKTASAIKQYIGERNTLHDVFPGLQPGQRWQGGAFDVKRDGKARDFSVQSIGVHGSILGTRIDLLILDDILTYENTRTPGRREDVISWLTSTLFTRLTRAAKVIFVGNAWHPEDAMHELGKRWTWRRYPVRSEDGTLAWKERWPVKRIEEKEAELGPLESARMLYCQPRSDDASRFKDAWFELCKENGRGRMLRADCTPSQPYQAPPGVRTFTGVDLGVGKKRANARTVLFTAARWPDARQLIPAAPAGQHANEVLNIRSGKWHAEEILTYALEEQRRFGSQLIVEAVAAQRFMARFIHIFGGSRDLPVVAFNTDKRKHHPQFGVEGMAVGFSLGLWCIPAADDDVLSVHPEVAAWIEDMRFYDPAAHTGDFLMASWMAAEGAAGRAARYAIAIAEEDPSGQRGFMERNRHVMGVERTPVKLRSDIQGDAAERRRLMEESQAQSLWDGLDALVDLGDDLDL